MASICPICPDSLAHKLRAYLQELGSISPSDHRSVDDMLNCGLDAFPSKHVAASKNKQQTRVLYRK
jgi:hypothetical protein